MKKVVYISSCGDSVSHVPGIDSTKREQKIEYKILFNVMKKFPDCYLVIKGRAGWDMNRLPEKIAREEKFNNFEFIENADPLDLLHDADVVIVDITTMAFDALLLNKPVISMRINKHPKFQSYENDKGIITVHNEKELEKEIGKLLN